MAKALTEDMRNLRISLVEVLVAHAKEYESSPEYLAEMTKQIKRIAKFLCVAN